MKPLRGTGIKVAIFMVVMLMVTAALFAIFAQYRGGPQNTYSAVFADASSLKEGYSVRVAGVQVGSVNRVNLDPDNTVTVGFGRHAVLGVADQVIDAVKSGAIRHFFLIGGCDGAAG